MSEQLVRALIERRIAAFAEDNDLTVQWEDVTFSPPATSYLKFNFLPARSTSLDLAGQHICWSGIAQIGVYVPSGNGPKAAGDIVDQLTALFPCNLMLSSDPAVDGVALDVLIVTPLSAPSGSTDKAHYSRPAFFQYRCDFVLL